MATQVPQTAIYYPESDGEPMGETDTHVQAIIDTIRVLSDFFRLAPTVLVGGNMMMYYEEGNPRRSVSPDTFVVRGVSKHSRRTYKIWEEGVPPTVVFEFTSRSTGRDDITSKPVLYASLGVQEYFLLDPLMEYLVPVFQGFRLVDGRYEQLSMDISGGLQSDVLGLTLRHEGARLRFIDLRSGEPLLWPDEVAESNRQATVRARMEADARRQAESVARMEAEARRQAESVARMEAEARRQAESVARMEAEARRQAESVARMEADARRQMEAQFAELQAELARLRDASSS